MVKKFKLYGIGNHNQFNYYIFEKKKEVILTLSEIISELFHTTPLPLETNYQNKKGNHKRKKINYEKKKDWHELFYGDNARADIFFGNKKIFVTLICSNKLRLKFNNKLNLITFNPKTKKWQ